MTVLRYAALSDRGMVRQQNQDRWYADGDQKLFVVADGIGGHFAGDLAARIVVELLPGKIRKAMKTVPQLSGSDAIQRVSVALAELSRQMRKESQDEPGLDGLGAAVVLALIRQSEALIVHIGDSRAYFLSDTDFEQLTTDHTVGQLLLKQGASELLESELAVHPAAQRLSRYIGMQGEALPESRVVGLQPGNRLLLCSDGLTRMVTREKLRAILIQYEQPQEACQEMIVVANEAGGKDNVTAIVVAVE